MAYIPSLFLICVSLLGLVVAIDRDGCAASIRGNILNFTLSANDRSFFSEIPSSLDSSVPLYIYAPVCREQCGGFSWYDRSEILGNIFGWLVPVLVLIGNMHMAPLGAKWQLFSLFHFIGDPVDSMLSLQHTLRVRYAAYAWAKQTVQSSSSFSSRSRYCVLGLRHSGFRIREYSNRQTNAVAEPRRICTCRGGGSS
jgi:hypothetical protein